LMIPKGYDKAAPGAMPDAKAVAAMMKYNESLQKAGVLLIAATRSEEHTSELQSRFDLVCRLLLEKKKKFSLVPGRPPHDPRYAARDRLAHRTVVPCHRLHPVPAAPASALLRRAGRQRSRLHSVLR